MGEGPVVVKQEIRIPLLGVIFLACLSIAVTGYLTKTDFGIIGILAWVVVFIYIGYAILWVLAHIFG